MTAKYAQSNNQYHSRKSKYDDSKQKFSWHWSLTFGIIAALAGGFTAFFVWQFTLISLVTLLLLVGISGALAFVLQWKLFYNPKFIEKHFRMPIGVYTAYNFIGIGIFAAGLILALNWLGADS